MITSILLNTIEDLIRNISGPLGVKVRHLYYSRRLGRLGKGTRIDVGVRFINPCYIHIGANTWIDNYVVIIGGKPSDRNGPMKRKFNSAFAHNEGEVHIGRNCHIAMFVVIQGHGGVDIGNDIGIASGCKVYSMSHHYSADDAQSNTGLYFFSPMSPPSQQSLIISPVVMKDGSALGLNSIALPGAIIGENSWVGSNSTARKAIPRNSIAVGSPAKVVKTREIERSPDS